MIDSPKLHTTTEIPYKEATAQEVEINPEIKTFIKAAKEEKRRKTKLFPSPFDKVPVLVTDNTLYKDNLRGYFNLFAMWARDPLKESYTIKKGIPMETLMKELLKRNLPEFDVNLSPGVMDFDPENIEPVDIIVSREERGKTIPYIFFSIKTGRGELEDYIYTDPILKTPLFTLSSDLLFGKNIGEDLLAEFGITQDSEAFLNMLNLQYGQSLNQILLNDIYSVPQKDKTLKEKVSVISCVLRDSLSDDIKQPQKQQDFEYSL